MESFITSTMVNLSTATMVNLSTATMVNFSTTQESSTMNMTTMEPSSSILDSGWVGYIALLLTVVLFGTYYTPVKKVNPGDGVFYQCVMSTAILSVGVVIAAIRGFPNNYPLAMLSGVLWATANVCVVPIVAMIGLGPGTLLWSCSSMILGWASGRFGWFGLIQVVPTNTSMNYAGLALALLALFLFILIKTKEPEGDAVTSRIDTDRLARQIEIDTNDSGEYVQIKSPLSHLIDQMPPLTRRLLGSLLALITGCCFGQQVTSIIYITDHPEIYPNASSNTLDYLFLNALGIYVTGTFYFLIYFLIFRQRIWIRHELILPALTSGTMWALGQAAFLVTVHKLSLAVSYPILSSLNGAITVLLSAVYFKEINGFRSHVLLVCALLVTITGVVLNVLSGIL